MLRKAIVCVLLIRPLYLIYPQASIQMQFVNIFIIKFCLFCEANFYITFSPERETQALNKECCKPAVCEISKLKTYLKKKVDLLHLQIIYIVYLQ